MRRALCATVLALGACTDEVIITPVIDGPVNDLDADGFAALTTIELGVAHAGDPSNIKLETFQRGQPLEISGTPFDDDLVVHMSGLVGMSHVAYGRTCPFQLGAERAPPSPHLFFSRTVKFAGTALVPAARDGGRAVSFLGSGVFLGGSYAGTPTRAVERFDPVSGELKVLDSVSERTDAVEALLGTGTPRIVLLGGQVDGTGAPFIELIEPDRTDRAVERHPEDKMARIGMTATSLTDGRVIAIGGHPPQGAPVSTITEITLVGATPASRDLRAGLAHARTQHTATRLGGAVGAPVLIAGGIDAAGVPVATAELFYPLSGLLAEPAIFAPAMVVPRRRHQAVLMPDDSVLIIGGVDATNQPVRTLELFSREGGFEAKRLLPVEAGVIDMTVTPLPDGRILLTGGRVNADPGTPPTDTAYIVRLDTGAGSVDVVLTDHLGVARAGHQAAALCDGTILITGGAGGGAIAERYNPPDAGRR